MDNINSKLKKLISDLNNIHKEYITLDTGSDPKIPMEKLKEFQDLINKLQYEIIELTENNNNEMHIKLIAKNLFSNL